jgi:hypothetical protein
MSHVISAVDTGCDVPIAAVQYEGDDCAPSAMPEYGRHPAPPASRTLSCSITVSVKLSLCLPLSICLCLSLSSLTRSQGEVICNVCAYKQNSHGIPLRMACAICGTTTWTNGTALPGQVFALKPNESFVCLSIIVVCSHYLQAMRCRNHDAKAYMEVCPPLDCFLCKIPTQTRTCFPAVLCGACSSRGAILCSYVPT